MTTTTRPSLRNAPSLFRSQITRGLKSDSVDREGGDFNAGLIRRTAVITRGEALGHGVWIDATFLDQTNKALNASGTTGIKSHFTHPDASGDGLSSFLGRHKDSTIVGDTVFADAHIAASSHDTPDGDLGGYVMDRAEEDAESFGQSIAFEHDAEAESQFAIEHGATVKVDWMGEYLDFENFESPDPRNTENLPHARLKTLRAVDIVDDPAANPDGLFHSGRKATAADADKLLSYSLGLTKDRPRLSSLDIDPDRLTGFVARYLARNNLELQPKQEPEPMTDPKPEPASPSRADFTAELGKYTDRFGAENGTAWFTGNKTWEEALDAHCSELETQLAAKDAEIVELQKKAETLRAGEPAPMDLGPDDPKPEQTGYGRFNIRMAGAGADQN